LKRQSLAFVQMCDRREVGKRARAPEDSDEKREACFYSSGKQAFK
jgi:hypothetical protein